MAKVKKVNIAVTYLTVGIVTQYDDTQQTILITIVKIKCMRTLIAKQNSS